MKEHEGNEEEQITLTLDWSANPSYEVSDSFIELLAHSHTCRQIKPFSKSDNNPYRTKDSNHQILVE